MVCRQPSEKWWSESQLGVWHSQLNGKIKNVPNHQPEKNWLTKFSNQPVVATVCLSGCAVESHSVRGVVCLRARHRAWHGGTAAVHPSCRPPLVCIWAFLLGTNLLATPNSGCQKQNSNSLEKLEHNWDIRFVGVLTKAHFAYLQWFVVFLYRWYMMKLCMFCIFNIPSLSEAAKLSESHAGWCPLVISWFISPSN